MIAIRVHPTNMTLSRLSLLLIALLPCAAGHAQDFQSNNRGIIVNQVLVVPTVPVKTSVDYLQDYEVGRAASAEAGATAANEYLRNATNRNAASAYRSELGASIGNSPLYRVTQPLEINYSYFFDTSDNLRWTLPVGTLFRFMTAPGPGSHAKIRLTSMSLDIPATYNGFSHTPEVSNTAYLLVNKAQFE